MERVDSVGLVMIASPVDHGGLVTEYVAPVHLVGQKQERRDVGCIQCEPI